MMVSGKMFHFEPQVFEIALPLFETAEILSPPAVERAVDQEMGDILPFRVRRNILQQEQTSLRQNPAAVFEQLLLLGIGEMMEHIADHYHVEFFPP